MRLQSEMADAIKVTPLKPTKWLTHHAVNHRLKDGSPATEKSARYSVHGYSLVIKDVTTEDAGDYTILLGIKQSNLFKNLTATLIVNGRFNFVLPLGFMTIIDNLWARKSV